MSATQGKVTGEKIVHVVISLCVGGAEKLVYDMVRHPAFAGNRPAVCCLDTVGELGERLLEEGYRVHVKNRRSGIDLSVVSWLRSVIAREGATVVHAHQYTPLFYATPAALLAGGVKVVYTEHGRFYPDRKSWKRAVFNPVLALGVDRLISISHCTAQAMARYDNLPLRRIEVIHNGVNLSRLGRPLDLAAKRREVGVREGERIVGTAARLDTIKDIPTMLRGFRLVLESVPEAVLLIAGEGPQGEELKRLAGGLGIADRVRFLGLRFDMPEIYQLYEVFLLTSFSEGISVTLLEAMGSGVPAVVTDVGGNPEVVLEGGTGFLVPVGEDRLLAERIVRLLKDPALAARLGREGRERAATLFSFDTMVDRYRACYGSLSDAAAQQEYLHG